MLLQKRSKNKKSYPNCLALCAGHVTGNETTIEAAVKEANEELGLALLEDDIKLLQEKTRNDREDNKCFATCYYKVVPNDIVLKKQDAEVDGLMWVPFSEFCEMVKNQNKNVCIFKNNEYYQGIIKNLISIFSRIKAEEMN